MFQSAHFDSLVKRFHENKLPHAFLLETNDYDKCYIDLFKFIKLINCPNEYKDNCSLDNCNLCNLIDTNNLPSLFIIDTDTLSIKIDKINELKEKFSTKPVFSKYNVYVIKEADKLNASSGNALLKFLEEPDDDIIGFFVTNNSERIISTIKSRCQVINCTYDIAGFNIDDEMLDNIKIFLNSIYNNKDDILCTKNVIDLYSERADLELFFKKMLYYFNECYFGKRKDLIPMVRNIKKENIINIIVLIEEILKYILSNVNIDLILDKFVIEMRKYYE